ncbi:MAG: hypothetical protein O7C62_06020, partial [Rickettsia endosymbiont of Ixodes persulcatus]|nr:hypothetical protein [Rickettsia endosymbiont of Ixodes persulcatus]
YLSFKENFPQSIINFLRNCFKSLRRTVIDRNNSLELFCSSINALVKLISLSFDNYTQFDNP